MPSSGDVLVDIGTILAIISTCIMGLRAMVRSNVRDEMNETNARLWAICKHLGIEPL